MTDEEIAQLQAAAVAAVTAVAVAFLASVAAVVVSLVASGLGGVAVAGVVRRMLGRVDWGGVEQALLGAAGRAYASGRAGRVVDGGADVPEGLRLFVSQRLAALQVSAGDVVDRAGTADPGDIGRELERLGRDVTGAAEWTAAQAANEGVLDEARDMGVRVFWRAERDACLACLSYSGAVISPGEVFAPLVPGFDLVGIGPVMCPPRHPHCRCSLVLHDGPGPSRRREADDAASAQYREARRSMALGWSAYSSQVQRLRAAQRMVAMHDHLPQSVIARAEDAVAKGKFDLPPWV